MENIIVTATNISRTFLYDLELPTDVTGDKLKADVVEALNGQDNRLMLNADSTVLFCNRIGRQLGNDETLKSAGVWNGDYITLMEV